MMTLDEAIAHAKEKASEQRRRFEDIYGQEEQTEAERKEAIACLDCSKEHAQLVAWLEELQERRATDRWISINEKLPDKNGNYLVLLDNGEMTTDIFDKEELFMGFWGYMTHWRTLPKAPESEAENE